ncbi:hypothetical protein GCM10010912_15590 [Paenibacillus albidus]|uniref:Uncharacterized protein n=1 Tax=Paenibacillus albidus TaxID=2041023 RepID=A0A917C4A8_9BACL|nr:hypothetical protein GCM10010912_15590 [Paenibacillus albidus]
MAPNPIQDTKDPDGVCHHLADFCRNAVPYHDGNCGYVYAQPYIRRGRLGGRHFPSTY